ncbi:MAG TPA: hypothetical protein VGO67_09740 [Verrucomicrobiae bacterium]|jgi:hypothetical protein
MASQDALEEQEKARKKSMEDASAERDEQVNRLSVIQQTRDTFPDKEKYESAVKLANEAIEEANQKLNEEVAAHDQAVHAVGSNTVATKRLKEQSESLNKEYDKLVAHNQELTDAIASLTRKIKEITASIELHGKYDSQIQNAQDTGTHAQVQTEINRAATRPQSAPTPEEVADQSSIGHYRTESGTEGAIDANDAITKARIAAANLRGTRPQDRTAEQNEELHELLNEIVGLAQNHASEINSQRRDLEQQRRIISNLISQSKVNRLFSM